MNENKIVDIVKIDGQKKLPGAAIITKYLRPQKPVILRPQYWNQEMLNAIEVVIKGRDISPKLQRKLTKPLAYALRQEERLTARKIFSRDEWVLGWVEYEDAIRLRKNGLEKEVKGKFLRNPVSGICMVFVSFYIEDQNHRNTTNLAPYLHI